MCRLSILIWAVFCIEVGPPDYRIQLLMLCSLLEPRVLVLGFIKNAGCFPSIFPLDETPSGSATNWLSFFLLTTCSLSYVLLQPFFLLYLYMCTLSFSNHLLYFILSLFSLKLTLIRLNITRIGRLLCPLSHYNVINKHSGCPAVTSVSIS